MLSLRPPGLEFRILCRVEVSSHLSHHLRMFSWPSLAYRYTKVTQNVKPMLFLSWVSVVDGGPALEQHRFNVRLVLTVYYMDLFIFKCESPFQDERIHPGFLTCKKYNI